MFGWEGRWPKQRDRVGRGWRVLAALAGDSVLGPGMAGVAWRKGEGTGTCHGGPETLWDPKVMGQR